MALSSVKLFAGKAGAGDQRLELCPHDRRMYAAVERPLCEAAIASRHQVFAAHQPRDPHQPLGDELRMLDDVGRVADHAWHEFPSRRQRRALPYAPFVRMARAMARTHSSALAYYSFLRSGITLAGAATGRKPSLAPPAASAALKLAMSRSSSSWPVYSIGPTHTARPALAPALLGAPSA